MVYQARYKTKERYPWNYSPWSIQTKEGVRNIVEKWKRKAIELNRGIHIQILKNGEVIEDIKL